MTYYAPNVPGYVKDFIGGGYRGLHLDKLAHGVWSLWSENSDRALLVRAVRAPGARAAITDFVARAAPKTDKRRSHWEYT